MGKQIKVVMDRTSRLMSYIEKTAANKQQQAKKRKSIEG
jgi:hypothetical protein